MRRAGTSHRAAALSLLAIAAGSGLGLAGAAGAPRPAVPADAGRSRVDARDDTPGMAASEPHNAFVFTRAIYSGGRGFRGFGRGSWSTDYPKSDLQFLTVLRRLVDIDAYGGENAMRLDDPAIRRFPFLYMLEVGYMRLTPEEVQGLRGYLLAGGFVMVDDFWGTAEWYNFEAEIQRVLPEYPIVEIPLEHPLFASVYQMREVLQVPNVNNARWGQTWERDGYVPHVRGIFDEKGRLMVAINWNTDLGDAWEWAEQPDYPVRYSTYAFQVGVNTIIYAMSH